MVENDQNIGMTAELVENRGQMLFARCTVVLGHGVHPELSRGARNIVHAEVKDGALIRDGPFNSERHFRGAFGDAETEAGVNIVVVGQGDEWMKVEPGDLLALEVERGGRG